MLIQPGSTILFIGDSVTDCGAGADTEGALGNGYVRVIAGELGYRFPEQDIRVLNRGVSGNRVVDLQARWQRDCLELKPDVLSVYIGINDTWRRYDRDDPTDAETFAARYRDILTQARDTLNCKIVLVEPFVLPVPEDRRQWREDLDGKIAKVRELAEEFASAYVPLDGLFIQAMIRSAGPSHWAPDGVHPSAAGHALIANAWLNAAGIK